MNEIANADLLEWAVASAPLEPWDESGDLHFVTTFAGGGLAAAIDGLGHGPEAAIAARAAVEVLRQWPAAAPTELVVRCHEALRKTRGVAMTLVSFDAATSTLTWLGVGNVEAILLRRNHETVARREAILARAGVVGYQLPPLNPRVLSVAPGDVVLLATDGISSSFASTPHVDDDLQHAADEILTKHGKRSDDALVLVTRYVGGST